MAKLLLYPLNWFASTPHTPCSGGEVFLYSLTQYLIQQGHEVRCICLTDTEYTHDGVPCYSMPKMQAWQIENNEHCKWADIIVTQLNGANMALNKARQHDKPLFFIAHNTVKSYMVQYYKHTHILYNSHFVKYTVHPQWDKPNMVCTPPIDYRNYKRTTNGKYITLVNVNSNKGGELFVELASALPQYQFLGVKGGYGEQITADLPNLTYLENGADMGAVYANTAILLQPSSFETYGQAVLEAMCCGIPVIAHPTVGLVECIGNSGQYADRNNLHEYIDKIVNLMEQPNDWGEKAYERAKSLDPLSRLKEVEEWIQDIIEKHGTK